MSKSTKKPHCCPNYKNGFCKMHSRFKMVIYWKNEFKKNYDSISFYSFLKNDRKPEQESINVMMKNLEPNFTNQYTNIEIYNRDTNTLVFKHKP